MEKDLSQVFVRLLDGGPPLKIHSPALRAALGRIDRRREDPEALRQLTTVIANDPDLERFLSRLVTENAKALDSVEGLAKAIEFQKTHPGWWSQRVEARFEALAEDIRDDIESELGKDTFDVSIGISKGLYSFVKDFVTLVPDLIEMGWDLLTDLEAQKKIATFLFIWYFGSDEMRKAIVREMGEFFKVVLKSIADKIQQDWEKAKKEGKADEYVAKVATLGVLNVVTLGSALFRIPAVANKVRDCEYFVKLSKKLSHTKFGKNLERRRAVKRYRNRKKSGLYPLRPASRLEVLELFENNAGARQALELVPATNREKILTYLEEFIPSSTRRDPPGVTSGANSLLVGGEFLRSHPHILTEYISEANKVLKQIQAVHAGQEANAIKTYVIVREARKGIIKEALGQGLKGNQLHDFMAAVAQNQRLGAGRYVALEPETCFREVFRHGEPLMSNQYLLSAEFRPTRGINSDFLLVPSVRSEGKVALNILDRESRELENFRNVSLVAGPGEKW